MTSLPPNPSGDRFTRSKSVFLAVLDHPEDQRPNALDQLCAGDTTLRDEVAQLLVRHATDSPLDRRPPAFATTASGSPEPATDAPPVHPGQTLGPYTITAPLGAGGMGVVFEARHRVTAQPIALKLIRPDAATPRTRRRFEAEGRALARLRHPGIAQVHDAGIARPDDDINAPAIPYIAMELVRGRPITTAAADLPRDDRLRLIEQAARAVHHAHLNGVVHRDLKPANVLVDDQNRVKVLDFGIAKLTEPDETAPAVTTHAGQIIGTPAYMSPEQLGADPLAIDHRADVYALGVILFEVLTGRRPIETDTASDLWSVLRRVEQGPPALASVDRTCRGDLDVITAVALRADPAERYQSAAELADDLARHLEARPILARPRTRRYIVGRFIKRNPWPVALGAAAAMAIAAGTTGIAIKQQQAAAAERRANERFNETRELARTVLFDLSDAIERLPGSTSARLLLASTAQSYLDRLAADPAAGDELRLEVAEGYTKLGDVLGFSYGPNLGDRDGAIRNWRNALAILEPMAARPDPPLRVLIATVNALQGMNSVLGFSQTGTAADVLELQLPVEVRCRELMARATALAPDDPRVARLRIETSTRHALVVWSLPEVDAALTMFDAALANAEADHQRWPDDHRLALATAEAAFWYGYVLFELERTDQARPLNDRAERLCRELALAAPNDARVLQRLSTAIVRGAQIAARAGEAEEALRRCDEAVARFERHAADDPDCQYMFRACNVMHAQVAGIYAELESTADPADIARRAMLAERALHHARASADMIDARILRGWLWPWEADYPASAAETLAAAQARLDTLTAPPATP